MKFFASTLLAISTILISSNSTVFANSNNGVNICEKFLRLYCLAHLRRH
jgi:hypothetical protein